MRTLPAVCLLLGSAVPPQAATLENVVTVTELPSTVLGQVRRDKVCCSSR